MSEKIELTEAESAEIINEMANARKEFERRVKESGHTPQMFVVMDRTGFATQMLYMWDQAKQLLRDNNVNIDIEPLVPGVEIREVEEGEEQ